MLYRCRGIMENGEEYQLYRVGERIRFTNGEDKSIEVMGSRYFLRVCWSVRLATRFSSHSRIRRYTG